MGRSECRYCGGDVVEVCATDCMNTSDMKALAAKDAEIERLKRTISGMLSNLGATQPNDIADADTIAAAIRQGLNARIAQLESDNKELAAEADGLEGACVAAAESLDRAVDAIKVASRGQLSAPLPEVLGPFIEAREKLLAVLTQPRKETQE